MTAGLYHSQSSERGVSIGARALQEPHYQRRTSDGKKSKKEKPTHKQKLNKLSWRSKAHTQSQRGNYYSQEHCTRRAFELDLCIHYDVT
jgi:hypothetical protein